jgi:hypothetical protein
VNEHVKFVLSDPRSLWAVLTSRVRVLGPWVKAKKPGVEIGGGIWRLNPSGKDAAIVYPSEELEPPEYWQFNYGFDDDSYDEEAYEQATSKFAAEREIWKPWTFSVKGHERGYADSREQAQDRADAVLRSQGVLLLDSLEVRT